MRVDFYAGIQLDGDSPVPLYSQIMESIRRAVESGQILPLEKLPSEREIAEKLNVNRLTVRQAVGELVSAGILTRRRGLGTYVARPKVEQALNKLTSFTEDMRNRGFRTATRLLELQIAPADRKVSQALGVAPDEPVIAVERLRLADEEPMALEVSHLPAARFPDLLLHKHELAHTSLYEILRACYNVTLDVAEETLEARLASAKEASLLEIHSGSPVLQRERVTLDQDGTPVEFVRSLYRADRYKFMVRMGR